MLAAAIAALALSLPIGTGAQAAGESMGMKHGDSSASSMEMHQSMMNGMKDMESMKPSGDTDQDFAMMMKKQK